MKKWWLILVFVVINICVVSYGHSYGDCYEVDAVVFTYNCSMCNGFIFVGVHDQLHGVYHKEIQLRYSDGIKATKLYYISDKPVLVVEYVNGIVLYDLESKSGLKSQKLGYFREGNEFLVNKVKLSWDSNVGLLKKSISIK